ncbi:Peptidyl-prolyl cis-trans isomerase FKBP12 [Geodia barretti]|uniref:peptidylprolyl isomerase n=1 Tax=Geodia barretti TaxID=519541 RepID=A0AA35S017_GEOBA|nr:Peptidyl-prolyl cis-trans isomerase FKBP12 [Geodia barretti]
MAQLVVQGVMKQVLKEAPAGARAVQRGDNVTVHCTGHLQSTMKKFWSTRDPGQRVFSFQVGMGKVIQGWDDGCLTMKVGEGARFSLSAEKAYGSSGFPAWGIPPNAPLVFDIEIVSIS